MSTKKDLKAVLREAENQGWRVELKKGHYTAYAPDGENAVRGIPSTPSSQRTVANTVARLRRYGFKWKGH